MGILNFVGIKRFFHGSARFLRFPLKFQRYDTITHDFVLAPLHLSAADHFGICASQLAILTFSDELFRRRLEKPQALSF